MGTTTTVNGKFGRILLGVNGLATVGLIATAMQGYGFAGFAKPEALERHLLWGLATTLVIFFAHAWVFIYLLSLRRELTRSAGLPQNTNLDLAPPPQVRPAALWAAGALVLVLGAFLLGPAILISTVPAWSHGTVAYVALGVQILALIMEFRALGHSDRALASWATATPIAITNDGRF